MERHRDQSGGGRVGLLGEVRQRRSTAQPDDRRAVAAWHLDATADRRRHVVELLTPLLLRLATAHGPPAAAAERALGAAAAAAALAEAAAAGGSTTGGAGTG